MAMTHRTGSFYTVKDLTGNGGLCTTPRSEESVEESRKLIDESNARAVQKGYRANQYAIHLTIWHRCYDGDLLILSERSESYIETYPTKL